MLTEIWKPPTGRRVAAPTGLLRAWTTPAGTARAGTAVRSSTAELLTPLASGVVGDVRWLLSEARHGRLQRAFALMATLSALVSGWEAYVQHLRGAYSDWPMWTPVVLTPPMVAAGLGSLISQRLARTILPGLSVLVLVDGVAGFVLHLRGVQRLPGGFRLAVYNITMGPPLFAPLFFLSVGLLGLLASLLQPERLPGRH